MAFFITFYVFVLNKIEEQEGGTGSAGSKGRRPK
jgi:hypothetical protein